MEECLALPRPIQSPRPPIIVGGAARKKSLDIATKFADEYNCYLITLKECIERQKRVERACEEAGREIGTLKFSLMTTCIIGETSADVMMRTQALIDLRRMTGVDTNDLLREWRDRWIVGTVAEATERLKALRDAGVRRVYLHNPLHDDTEMVEMIGAIAPVVN
jgi:alkanesulfonate monooxygenase SsuD/methylene tetrahydromethanopterin reductase-like flavin-dependent oxidoreductase (luciferase family)